MTPRTILLLLLAASTAGGTAWFVNGQLNKRSAPPIVAAAPAPTPMTEILVAKKELATGTFIKPEFVTWQIWPKDAVAAGYLVKGTVPEHDLAGAVVRSRLYAGEPLTKDRVLHPGEKGFLAAVIETGKRAVAVPVDATSGVGGFVFPGDSVDVLLTLGRAVEVEDDGSNKKEKRHFSQTLLTDVRVLGIDQTIDGQGASAKVAKTATLEVTPKQAEKLAVARGLGDLSLSLRSIGRNEVELEALTALARHRSQAPGTAGSYTRDSDILSMIGDPLGLPMPGVSSARLNILRGSEATVVRY